MLKYNNCYRTETRLKTENSGREKCNLYKMVKTKPLEKVPFEENLEGCEIS